ncbi:MULTISPECIES: serine protease [unclassified Flavobacterium]|uniref:S1 family peptidase n=1 Tax=unclassified Flavobacterium TaxID=196869 RepID=UPI0008C600C9|nr:MULTISPECIES: serine protease [unclassified Flavobacterium]SEP08369.1 Trypsin-like peptidase domain-containing protein [Flavobacterium sp. fv08]
MDFSNEYLQVQNSVIRVISTIGQGSGVLIGDGTRALTCSHCIVPNNNIVGALSGQNHGQIGTVIFNDANLDIAIIEFQIPLGSGVALGNSDSVKIGQEGFVLGFPSHTNNITALGAHIAGFESNNGIQLIKIDASINHGNSGGPLFNSAGELIGIVNAKFGNLSSFLNQIQQTNADGITMSIGGIDPVLTLKQLIVEMKKNLNLGMGSAIPLKTIGSKTNIIGNLLV